MTLSNQALLEISDLSFKAEHLAKGSPSDRTLASVYLSRIANINRSGISSDEMRGKYSTALAAELTPKQITEKRYTKAFEKYFVQGDEDRSTPEFRDLAAGAQSIAYTQGVAGGYAIPLQYNSEVFEGMSQTDPVLSDDVVDFEMSDSPALQPKTVSGYDLSSVTAQLIGESTQQLGQAFAPVVGGKILRGDKIWRTAVLASLESETDIPNLISKICRCYGVAFGRSLGATAVSDLLAALPAASYSTSSGLITATDLLNIYFNVNVFHRNQSKCSWFFSDWVYERIRKAVDNQGRPLLNMVNDQEMLLGKPIHVSPSFGGGGSPVTAGTICFGDFQHWHLRCSRPTLMRAINVPNSIEYGRSYYTGRIRFSSVFADESSGNVPPVTVATVTP
jgi:hypothetical protein